MKCLMTWIRSLYKFLLTRNMPLKIKILRYKPRTGVVADMSSISAAMDMGGTGDGPFQARKKDLQSLV